MPRRSPRPVVAAAAQLSVVTLVPALAACGAATAHRTPVARAAPAPVPAAAAPASCGPVVDGELRAIAQRIYRQAAAGRSVAAVRRRLAASPALAAAVAHADAAATRAALRPLMKNQIRRIVIRRGAHVLADVGRTPALAPVRGVVRDPLGRPVGRYVFAVSTDAAIAGITQSLTGARIVMGPDVHATTSFAATAWPAGPLRIGLQLPAASPSACGATPAITRARVVGQVARRLFASESGGAATRRVLRHVAGDAGFRRAVATRDPVALRTAIVRFFGQRTLHVVRIRAVAPDRRLIGDVGGPYVLAPASTPVRAADGTRIGTVTLSIQDDAGYVKLVHRFTGAGVALSTAAGTVPFGVAVAGPVTPVRFTVGAFPSGPLAVTLSVPQV